MTTVLRPEAFASADLAPETVRDAVHSALGAVRDAVAGGDAVVIVVPAGDLLGHGGPERGALAGALVGLARAAAFEGARKGWSVNVLAVPEGDALDDANVVAAVPDGASGQVVTLGTGLVGKVAP